MWDRDGFVLWYKRLEAGVFKSPRVKEGARSVELRASELAMILDGIAKRRCPGFVRTVVHVALTKISYVIYLPPYAPDLNPVEYI
jgi:hypothetical protein